MHFIDAVATLRGRDVVDAGLARLDPAVRAQVDALGPLTWVPSTVMGDIVEVLAAAAGVTPEALIDEAVRVATRTSFNTVWRILIRLTSREALVARTPLIYAKTRNVGELSVVESRNGAARLALRGYPDVSDRQLQAIAVSIETILDMTGRRGARCRWSKSDGGGTFELTWGAETAQDG